MSEIFLSYRRDDSSGFAGALVRELNDEFGDERVFMDVDDIKGGVDFTERIQEELAACEILVAIIGKQWLTHTDQKGRRRLDDPGDLVRIEVATALAQSKVVVPLLVKGAPMPTKEDLPEDLQALALRNAVEVSNTNWTGDIGKLKDVLYEHLSASPEVQSRREMKERQARKSFLRLLILPWLAAALVLGPLSAVRKSAEVEVRLTVERLSFRVGKAGAESFLSAIPTESLTLQAFEWIDLGSGELRIATAFDEQGLPYEWTTLGRKSYRLDSTEPEWSSVTFDIPPQETSPASTVGPGMTLNQLDLAPDTLVTLAWDREAPLGLQVRAVGNQANGRLGAPLSLSLRCDRCQVDAPADAELGDSGDESLVLRLDRADHQEIGFLGAPDGSTLAFELPSGTQIVKQDIAVAGDLRFLGGRLPDVTSSVIGDSGSITIEDLDRSFDVKEGEFVHLGDPDRLLLRTVELDNGIALSLHGRVGSLSTGSAGFVRNRLPSALGWVYGRAAWLVYLVVAGLAATTALALVRRSRTMGGRR